MMPLGTFQSHLWHFARHDLAAAYLHAFDLKLSSARGFFVRRRMGISVMRTRHSLNAYVAARADRAEARAPVTPGQGLTFLEGNV
jgi:hypothetical protein